MGSTNNKFIAALAVSNILGFIVIFALLWMLWTNNNATTPEKKVIFSYSPSELQSIQPAAGPRRQPENRTARPSVNAQDKAIITAVAKEVKLNIENDGRVEPITTKNNNANKDKTDGVYSDEEYIATFNRLKSAPEPARKNYTEKEVSSAPATDKPVNKELAAVDHFNKVDVSNIRGNQSQNLSLSQQVAMVAASDQSVSKADKSAAWKDYLSSLKEAEAERQNEMRTITVKRGDTLWKLSTRAYGTGFMYKKIFTANPHLTSPDSITVGETLRVPI